MSVMDPDPEHMGGGGGGGGEGASNLRDFLVFV